MRSFAQQLRRLAAASDWRGLAAADRKVAMLLGSLPPRVQWAQADHVAFDELRKAHNSVRELCDQEAARVQAQLEDMRRHRQGWVAYALVELEEAI